MISPWNLAAVLSVIISLLSYNLWEISPDSFIYEKGMAVTIALAWWAIYRRTPTHEWRMKCVFYAVQFWSVQNLVDEFIGDPTSKHWPEYAFAFIGIVFAYLKYKKMKLPLCLRKYIRF